MVDMATPLMYACQQGQVEECLRMLAKKPMAARERDRTKKTALHYCAEKLNTKCAEILLKSAPDTVNAQDEDGYTALHLSVIAGNKPFIQLLLNSGADINALDFEKHSVVHWATVCGEEEALEMVLRAGAILSCPDIHGGFPLHYAAQMCGQGDARTGLAVLRTLLSYNASVDERDNDGRQPILWAASAGSAEAILALVKAGAKVEVADKDGLTALHCAASRGHTDCLETLIALCGAHVDTIDINGCTALFYAVTLGHADATHLLLNLGAEPNRQDRKGRTPAHCGAAKGQLETLRLLLSGGSNLWLRNVKGDVPLHEAVASGRCELVTWLLNTRPEAVNVANNDGKCPIHVAAINNNLDIIKVLLDAGSLINPVLRSNKGEMLTPLDVALVRGHRSAAKYLQMHGGVPRTKLSDTSACLRGTMLSRDTACGSLVSRKVPPAFDVYPVQLSVQASQLSDERIVSGECIKEKTDQTDINSRSIKKKLRKRRSERKQENESSSEDSDVSSSCSRQHRKSGGRRRSKPDKRKSEKTNDQMMMSGSENSKKTDSEDLLDAEKREINANGSSKLEEEKGEEKGVIVNDDELCASTVALPIEKDNSEQNPVDNYHGEIDEELPVANIELPDDNTPEVPEDSPIESVPSIPTIPDPPTPELPFNPDSSLEETSPVLPELVTVEAEVYPVNSDSHSPEKSPDDTQNHEEPAETPTPTSYEDKILIEVNSPREEVEEKADSVKDGCDSVKRENSLLQKESSTDTSSQAEDEIISKSRPVTARRRSMVQINDALHLVDNTNSAVERDELAFYTLPDDLSSERRSADGSEGVINGEDGTENIPLARGRRQSLAFDNTMMTMPPSEVPKRRTSDGHVITSRSRTNFQQDSLNDNRIFTRDLDIDTAIKDLLLANSQQRSSSVGDDSGASTRNDDSSALVDSGIEPSPRHRQNRSQVSRLCHRSGPLGSPAPISVTRAVQSTIRKYHLERKIFYQLLELKRMQIRAGCANEQVLVKRLVDDYQKAGRSAGLTLYGGTFSFRQFERFLYEQLHRLQAGRHPVIAKVSPSDDLESLSALLHKKSLELGQLVEEDAGLCTHLTHRCRHAVHAYTGIPCAAYITKFNHHTMPKETKYSFLPKIPASEKKKKMNGKPTERPVTLEVINGQNKQIISLPTGNLDRSKRYFVTFTIKGEEASPRSLSPAASGHYHAKTV